MRVIARPCTRTPPARSQARWRPAAASTHSGWLTAGTAPTACSAHLTQGASPDDPPPLPRAILRTLAADRGHAMKVLMVSWEYPPVVVGGLGRHVYQLATALAAAGDEVFVLSACSSCTEPGPHPSSHV